MKEIIKERTALTEHECSVCGKKIYTGERYVLEVERDENNKPVRICKHLACNERTKDNA